MSMKTFLNNFRSRARRGQALVEFGLVFPVLIAIIAIIIDAGPLITDYLIAKQASARGARAASVYLADGTRNCYQDVLDAVGTPPFLSVPSWSLSIDPDCTSSPTTTFVTGLALDVTVSVDYQTLFWGDNIIPFSVTTFDQAR